MSNASRPNRIRYPAVALAFASFTSAFAQSVACPAVNARSPLPAAMAYAQGNYADAADLYTNALIGQPNDPELAAGLVRAQLRAGNVSPAMAAANTAVAANPHNAAALTALAETQIQLGQPWLAMETLRSAVAADPCYARAYLVRSRVFRLDSMYASERNEIQRAYEIDPADPDTARSWRRSVAVANDIAGIKKALSTPPIPELEVRKLAEASIQSQLTVLSENSQTCRIEPAIQSATLPLLPVMQDGKHIDAYLLQAQFGRTGAKLQVDTAASGLYISRALAEANGLKQGEGGPAGTVYAESVRVGPLEFRDCMIGVSETPFPGRSEGSVGTDLFASYLITLDYSGAQMMLAPLPAAPDTMPVDRANAAELRNFTPVYHRQQYLLVPVTLNNRERRLFVLDSGIRYSAVTAETAHAASPSKSNSTSAAQSTSGATLQLYRDSFDFEFGNLLLRNQGHVLQLDTAAMERNAGLRLGGLLGFDMLGTMTVRLDYRDGLVKFESPRAETALSSTQFGDKAGGAPMQSMEVCPHLADADLSAASTVQVLSDGLWDSGHMKIGEAIDATVRGGWQAPDCRLNEGAKVYGHVTAVSKNGGNAQLGMVFDRGECFGQGRKELRLKIVGLYGDTGEFNALHNAVPTEVGGGTRQISAVVANLDRARDQNLSPQGALQSVRPGIVKGIPNLRLEPEGGPSCSALLTAAGRGVRVGAGTAILLVLLEPAAP